MGHKADSGNPSKRGTATGRRVTLGRSWWIGRPLVRYRWRAASHAEVRGDPMGHTTTAPDPPFVGRAAELQTLRQSIGTGRLVLLCGEAGIGKTRIAEELAQEADAGATAVHWGRCWEGEGAPAFWPWTQIIRAHLRTADPGALRKHRDDPVARLATLAPEIDDRATPTHVPPTDPTRARFQLFDAVTSFLRTAASTHPLVLVLEDLHWADVSSLALLQYVVRELDTSPVLIIATYRDADTADAPALYDAIADLTRHRHCVRLPLQGLKEDEVHTLVADRLGTVTTEFVQVVMRKTAGNPFFVTQLLQLLAREPPQALTGIPDGVRDALQRRLRGLQQSSRALLEIAAVIGDEFALATLHALELSPPEALLRALDDAISRRILAECPDKPGRYRFTHALIREALYDDLPLAHRVDLHTRVGEALERCYGASVDPHAAELAHHFLVAAVADTGARAISYAMRAGHHSSSVLAYEQAVAWYRMALDTITAWQPADQHATTTASLALGEAQVRAGLPKDAEETFQRVAALARTLALPEMLARAALGLGQVDRVHDQLGTLLDEALEALDAADSSLRARLLSLRAVVLYWAQPDDRKRSLSDAAIAMARRLDDVPTLTYVLSSRIASLSGPDDVELRLAAATEMSALGERCGDRELGMVGFGWSIADRLALAQIGRVRQDVETFAERARTVKHPYHTWWSAILSTMCTILEGRFAEGERLAQEALALGQHAVATDAAHVFAGQLYALRIEQERLRELEPIMRSIVDEFPAISGARCGLALLYAETDRAAEATLELERLADDDFEALPRNPEWLSSIAVLAQTTALLPSSPHAARLYDLLRPYDHLIIVSGLGGLCAGAVSQFLGLLATRLERWDAAADHLAHALRLHTKIGARIWVAYTHYESAMLASAVGDRTGTQTAAAEAARIGEELGMPRLRRKLDALDLPSVAEERPVPSTASAVPANGNGRHGVLRRDGDYWTLAYTGPIFHLKDSIGLRYIAALIQDPNREFLASDLVTALRSERGANGDPRPTLDDGAKREYRVRLEALRTEITEAETSNDTGRAAGLQTEIELLGAELTRAVGLGGPNRKAVSDHERARVSATRAIQAAVRRIGDNDPAFARHLTGAIHTGTFCSYTPDPGTPISWEI